MIGEPTLFLAVHCDIIGNRMYDWFVLFKLSGKFVCMAIQGSVFPSGLRCNHVIDTPTFDVT
jgi:hypothetical protein